MSPFAPRKDLSFLTDLSRSERRLWATDLRLRGFHNVAFRSAKGFFFLMTFRGAKGDYGRQTCG